MAARSIGSMQCGTIWPAATRPLSRLSRIMLTETAEQLGLDRVEWIRALQAHDLADPFRADQLRDVVMSRFECHPANNPLFVVIVDLIDSARLLPDTQPLDFVVVAAARHDGAQRAPQIMHGESDDLGFLDQARNHLGEARHLPPG